MWIAGIYECGICEHKHVAVIEVENEIPNLECPMCHHEYGHFVSDCTCNSDHDYEEWTPADAHELFSGEDASETC